MAFPIYIILFLLMQPFTSSLEVFSLKTKTQSKKELRKEKHLQSFMKQLPNLAVHRFISQQSDNTIVFIFCALHAIILAAAAI